MSTTGFQKSSGNSMAMRSLSNISKIKIAHFSKHRSSILLATQSSASVDQCFHIRRSLTRNNTRAVIG